eukprot:sb/3468419/
MTLFVFVCYLVVVSRGLSDDIDTRPVPSLNLNHGGDGLKEEEDDGNDGGCPIAVDNGFLVRSCQDRKVTSWDGFFMQCLNSSTMYNKTFTFDIATRSIKPYVTTLCPNDSIQYQACGSDSFMPLSDIDKKLFQTSPVCGKLCYELDKDMYGFHTSSQTCPEAHDNFSDARVSKTISTVEGESFTISIQEGGFCDGRCDEIEIDQGASTEVSKLKCIDERSCNGYNYGAVTTHKEQRKFVPIFRFITRHAASFLLRALLVIF